MSTRGCYASIIKPAMGKGTPVKRGYPSGGHRWGSVEI